VGGLLPLKQEWSSRENAPHGDDHRIFAPLSKPVEQSISADIPNFDDTAMAATNNYEDKLNRKLLRLQRERDALRQHRRDIIRGLTKERDSQRRDVARLAVDSHRLRLHDALRRARRRQWALYLQAKNAYEESRNHSRMRADEYLKRRDRIMSRVGKLDHMLSHGDGQMSTAKERWHSDWAPFETEHAGDGNAASLTVPDKRSWRKMQADYADYKRYLEQRAPLASEAAWVQRKRSTSSAEWRHRDGMFHAVGSYSSRQSDGTDRG